MGGLIGRILEFVFAKAGNVNTSEIKIDAGGGFNLTTVIASPPNQTSRPLVDDLAVLLKVPGESRYVTVGFVDPKAPQTLNPGEHMLYARNENGDIVATSLLRNDGAWVVSNDNGMVTLSADGTIAASADGQAGFEFRPDGSVTFGNGNGGIDIAPDGTVTINGATIDPSGALTADNITANISLIAAIVDMVNHVHAINSGSSAPGPTGPAIGP